jgi:hypothetical protein
MKPGLISIPNSFADPFTGYPPNGEVQMSGLLGLFHQLGKIVWSKVPLLLLDNKPSGIAAVQLLDGAAVCSEYQLFWSDAAEASVWGSMPADLLCLSPDRQSVVLIENKIGSAFTGAGSNPLTGQLAKQADFLLHCKIPKATLIILSTGGLFDRGWYRNELVETLRTGDRSVKVSGYLIRWEDIFAALH